ncbi:Hpt domain-containing protein [Celeribacter sp.]|uniref:Hpt domain-containing protein n=1 Tax=Celeribacter sp. TaxID=1890673 RepID=UPI003A8E107A
MVNKFPSDASMPSKLADAIGRTRQRFLLELPEKITTIEAIQTLIKNGDVDKDALGDLAFVTHRLSGISATVGYPEIGECAGKIHHDITKFTPSQSESLSFQIDDLLDLMEDAILDEI